MSTVVKIFDAVKDKLPLGTPLRGVVRAINDAVNEIDWAGDWSFWQAETDLVILAEESTGTVAVTQGSVDVVGTGTTITADMVGRKFTASSAEVYTIAARTDDTHFALDTAYVSASDSEAGFSIYQDAYALPSDLKKAFGFWDETNRHWVALSPPTAIKDMDVAVGRIGGGRLANSVVGQFGYNSDKVPQVIFYPRPSDAAKVPVWYYKRPTKVTGPADEPDMPDHMHDVIELGVLAHYTRDTNDFKNFRRAINNKLKEDSGLLQSVPVQVARGSMLNFRYANHLSFDGLRALSRSARLLGA